MSVNWTRDAAAHFCPGARVSAGPLRDRQPRTRSASRGPSPSSSITSRSASKPTSPALAAKSYNLQPRRPPAVVPGPHGFLAPAAGREDDLLLEPPLDLGHRQGPGRNAASEPEQDPTPVRHVPVRRPRRPDLAGPGHARLAGQRHQPRRTSQRELRPRAHGALLPRPRPLHRGGRARARKGPDRLDRGQLQPRHRVQRRDVRGPSGSSTTRGPRRSWARPATSTGTTRSTSS